MRRIHKLFINTCFPKISVLPMKDEDKGGDDDNDDDNSQKVEMDGEDANGQDAIAGI